MTVAERWAAERAAMTIKNRSWDDAITQHAPLERPVAHRGTMHNNRKSEGSHAHKWQKKTR